MVVPPYCRSRQGRVFRLLRSSQLIPPSTVRYALRAQPIKPDAEDRGLELTREFDTEYLRDKITHGQAVPSPETTFEELWQQLSLDLEARYG